MLFLFTPEAAEANVDGENEGGGTEKSTELGFGKRAVSFCSILELMFAPGFAFLGLFMYFME